MGPLQSAISVLTITVTLTEDIEGLRFVSCAGARPSAGGLVLGVTKSSEVAGRSVAVDVLGVIDMVAAAPIALGQEVQSDADGLPVPLVDGNARAGVALTAAANPGDIVKILVK